MRGNDMKIYDMRTEGMRCPIGLDNAEPVFSWKLSSGRNGARQSAYQITAAKDMDFSDIVWDSGRVISNCSIHIKYGGKIEPRTRYFWRVVVWDENNTAYTSDIQWFESGLMGSGKSVWNGAQWIGNPRVTENTYGVDTYSITGEYSAEDALGLVINARDKDNYILISIDNSRVIVSEICDGAWSNNKPYINTLGVFKASLSDAKRHSFKLSVNHLNVTLVVDGESIIADKNILPENPPNQPRKSYMMCIGFNQKSRAQIYSLKIQNDKTGSVYQDDNLLDDSSVLSALGTVKDGALHADGFEIICPVAAVNVRKCFGVSKNIVSARLYASARGFYEAYLNGCKIGEDFYSPGFTDYRLRIQYQTYDVTDIMRRGENVIGATVGKGHYGGFCGYSGSMVYGTENSFIAQLVIGYDDGSSEVIVTDSTWEFTDKGALVSGDYFDGEIYDARLAIDWTSKDNRWKKCGIKSWPNTITPTNGTLQNIRFELSAQLGPSARIVDTFRGKLISENPNGHLVYDFGQNMVGTIRLVMRGKRGTSVKIRYGEMMCPDGSVYIENLRTAANTDLYIFNGSESGEVFVPSFTQHGFRYADISISGNACNVIVSVEGLVISNVHEVTGDFECSNPLINQLQSNIQWGQRSNSLLVLTDCPQRNERMGWTGDAQVFAATGTYNMNMKEFTEKWLLDLRDAQLMYNLGGAVPDTAPLGGDNRPDGCGGWGDAAVIVPWELYTAYGDRRILEKSYESMKKWVDYQSRGDRQNYGVRVVDGIEVPEKSDLASIPFIQVQQRRGDHLTYDNSTPYIYCATAYAARCAKLLSLTAKILGKDSDAEKYEKRFKNIRRAFNEAWVEDDGSISYWGEANAITAHSGESRSADGSVTRYTYYSDDANSEHRPSQTAYALAIAFDLIPQNKLNQAAQCFKASIERADGKLTVGFLGISHLAPSLTKAGLDDLAFALLEQEENPSWLYSVKNGATTIWERWNSYIAETGEFGDVSMNSFNHYAYGAVGEWIFGRVLGIKPKQAGYKTFTLFLAAGGSLTYARGYHNSPYGLIKSSWRIDGSSFIYECTVPANTTAELYLPDGSERRLESGSYKFIVENFKN